MWLSEWSYRGPRMATLAQISTFNQELRALHRANIPLDLDLPASKSRADAALVRIDGELTKQLADNSAEEIKRALAAPMAELPVHYQRILLSGIRCGRLPAVMEALSSNMQRLETMRSNIATALVYPLVVCVLAYGFFIFLGRKTLPTLLHLQRDLESDEAVSSSIAGRVVEYLPIWAELIPILLLILLIWWFFAARRGTRSMNYSMGLLRPFPGIGRLVRDTQLANIANLTAMLTDHGMHDSDALKLASQTVVGRELPQTPPFLHWAISQRANPEDQQHALRLASDLYHERATQRAAWLRVMVPYACLAIVAGGIVLFYALLFWRPFCQIMQDLSALKLPM